MALNTGGSGPSFLVPTTKHSDGSADTAELQAFALVDSAGVERGVAANPFSVTPRGATYTGKSVASMTSGQAAGTSSVLPVNANRAVMMINPPSDCTMTIGSGNTTGWPLFGGVPNVIDTGCPTNAIFIYGLTLGANVVIWEA